jgi:hypothetical protein
MANVFGALEKALKNVCTDVREVPIVWAIGNNDLYPRYPPPPPPGKADPWLTYLQKEWPPLSPTWGGGSVGSFATTGCSNYTGRTDEGAIHLIAVHSNYWATESVDARLAAGLDDDPAGIFAWLNQTLAHSLAARLPTVIVGHIPPGVDHHSLSLAWHPQYLQSYQRLIDDFIQRGGQLVHSLWGHEHIVAQRIVAGSTQTEEGATHFLAGSISPIFGNNPTVRLLTLTLGDDVDEHAGLTFRQTVAGTTVTTAIQDYYLDLAANSTRPTPLYACGNYSCDLSVAQPLSASALYASLSSKSSAVDEYAAIAFGRAPAADVARVQRMLPDNPVAAGPFAQSLMCSTFCANSTSCLYLDPATCPFST